MKKKCSKCKQIKQDTAFPIYIMPIIHKPFWLYWKCDSCAEHRIIKRMYKFFDNFNTKM